MEQANRPATSIAAAMFEYLRQTPDIDSTRIGLVGHSEGGLIALQAATRSPEIGFVVLLAAPALPLADVIACQQRDEGKLLGIPSGPLNSWFGAHREFFRIAGSDADLPAKEEVTRALWTSRVLTLSAAERQQLGIHDNALDELLARLRHPGFLSALRFDPRTVLRRIECPVLALNGSKDLQVSAAENLPALRDALQGNLRAKVIELPRLNHAFQKAKTGHVAEYAQIEESFNVAAMETISRWILELAKSR